MSPIEVLGVSALGAAFVYIIMWFIDKAVDVWYDWQERHANEPIVDALDTEHEPDKKFVPTIPRT